jgi:ABC-type spermidine/putrescine transport system permease subunit I
MNPGPVLGAWAVAAAYAVVLVSLLVFIKVMYGKKKKLEARRKELLKG